MFCRVDTNLRHTVYCTGISQGTADDFNYLYTKYPQEQIPVERDNILYGLCCSKDPWALIKYVFFWVKLIKLKFVCNVTYIYYIGCLTKLQILTVHLSGNRIHSMFSNISEPTMQEEKSCGVTLYKILMHLAIREFIFQYNITILTVKFNISRFSSGAFSLSAIVQAVTQSFNTQSQVDQVSLLLYSLLSYCKCCFIFTLQMVNFLTPDNIKKLGSGLSQFYQQLQLAQSNVVWMQTYSEEVVEWFKTYLSSQQDEIFQETFNNYSQQSIQFRLQLFDVLRKIIL